MARNLFDNFGGAEWYVDFSGGDDGTGDGSIGNPWKTIKFAVETGITTPNASGDRVNVKSNATHTVATTIDPTQYASDGSASAPLIIQGFTTSANDGGIAVCSVTSGQQFISSTTFDFLFLADLDISGTHNSNPLVTFDRDCGMDNCSVVNSGTDSPAVLIDVGTAVTRCYLESTQNGTASGGTLESVAGGAAVSVFIKNNGTGTCVEEVDLVNSLVWSAGNLSAGSYLGYRLNSAINSALVCTGTANASSVGVDLNTSGAVGCYVENAGTAYIANSIDIFFLGNSYFNCTTALTNTLSFSSIAPTNAASSIFNDASTGDFSVVEASTPVQEIAITGGWASGTSSEQFQIYQDTGPGYQEPGGGGGGTAGRQGLHGIGQGSV